MIIGIGVDIVDISSFQEQLEDRASHFVQGTFTLREQRDATQRPGRSPTRHLAARYAAKEAFIKAWSQRYYGHPPPFHTLNMKEIEVSSDLYHRPHLLLHGTILRQVLQDLGDPSIHLSMSHDANNAIAFVVLQ